VKDVEGDEVDREYSAVDVVRAVGVETSKDNFKNVKNVKNVTRLKIFVNVD